MSKKQKLIAIIEDDDVLRRGLKVVFAKHKFDVITFANSKTVFESFAEKMPDVVLCDYKLPKQDGVEILKQIRKFDLETPFFLMTGYYGEELALEAKYEGANAVLEKPLNMNEIVSVCSVAVSKKVHIANAYD